MHPLSHREIVERVTKTLNERDFDGLSQLVHDDIVYDTPQSRERIKGLPNARAVLQNYPGLPQSSEKKVHGSEDRWVVTPSFTLVQITGSGDHFTTEEWVRYPSGETGYGVTLFEFRDEKISKITGYFAAPYPAPEWRSPWVQIMPERDKDNH